MENVNRFAVVTGASSGIGYELARELVSRGFNVLIVAEDDAIDAAARQLGALAMPVKCNLATSEGVERLWGHIKAVGRPIDVMCINAGVGVGGAFIQTKLAEEINVINLNVTGTVHLAKRAAVDMVAHGSGRILFTSSIASQMPGPFYAVYAASKAFVQSFAEALRNELAEHDVVVTSLMPGATDTKFFARADMLDTPAGQGKKDDPAEVARQGIEALLDGKDSIVTTGIKNKAQAVAAKVMSDPVRAKLHRKQVEPGRR
ncbi:MAG: SDR family NAD(P)-dependent oxidoreductase [Myxococcota bacterium]